MSINMVVADSIVKGLTLRYGADGKPEARWTLHKVRGEDQPHETRADKDDSTRRTIEFKVPRDGVEVTDA